MLPSGKSSADEWYMRGTVELPMPVRVMR